eukprot:2547959-Rhodomonas_salina.1
MGRGGWDWPDRSPGQRLPSPSLGRDFRVPREPHRRLPAESERSLRSGGVGLSASEPEPESLRLTGRLSQTRSLRLPPGDSEFDSLAAAAAPYYGTRTCQ